ncbi:MAG: aconitate hydratase AcnA [Pseudomonadota bacterium]
MDRQDFRGTINVKGRQVGFYSLPALEERHLADIGRLPFSIRILVENLLRKLDGKVVTEEDLIRIAGWKKKYETPMEIPFHPARVLMQDFTGVPAVVDLASMRDAVARLGGDPGVVNPLVPVELIIDHSVQVDYFGCESAAAQNAAREYERNRERYAFLKWAQNSFSNLKVTPPRSGICHQVNLEHLARVVMTEGDAATPGAFPDSLVGLDSHTTMINGLGVMGWGVGGIEAEAVMLGQPYYMAIPEVIGVRFFGRLNPGVTAADLVLTVTERLRRYKVVEKFVEFLGPGLRDLSLPDRATIANMSPEYGATMGFFPVDERTLEYLRKTGRSDRADLTEAYCRANRLFHADHETPEYTDVIEFDLGEVEPSVAGPSRPQDRIAIRDLKKVFKTKPREVEIELNGRPVKLADGAVVIAAITSCTNTSNPSSLIGAGLLAQKAVKLGLKIPPHVKTSFAPGSTVAPRFLKEAGLTPYLEALGFHVVGFGCTTCIGNSGPLAPAIEQAIEENGLNVAAVLSGNRNFEARIHQKIKSNFLASPLLTAAYALAGRVDLDLTSDPVGLDPNGTPVFLHQLMPSQREIDDLVARAVQPVFFEEEYARIFDGDEFWRALPEVASLTYPWDRNSTYIKNPPYFDGFQTTPQAPPDVAGARVLALLGDSVTTDHISPAGAIPEDYPAGRHLVGQGVRPEDFNSYGSRRGNHEVMMRGTFGNIRLKNLTTRGREGGFTRKFPENREMFIYDAARAYAREKTPLVVLGGKEYGTGSSRDWAAKGTMLLGVTAVIAGSFERIHRGNLAGMGVLPLQFQDGVSAAGLGLDGSETFFISGLDKLQPRGKVEVRARKEDGTEIRFATTARLNTMVEVEFHRHGGILPFVLRIMTAPSPEAAA